MQKRLSVISAALVTAACAAAPPTARAAQVFVCDDGKAITISDAGLADAIRHDPCVARYYGRDATRRVVPLPTRRPNIRITKRQHSAPTSASAPTRAIAAHRDHASAALPSGTAVQGWMRQTAPLASTGAARGDSASRSTASFGTPRPQKPADAVAPVISASSTRATVLEPTQKYIEQSRHKDMTARLAGHQHGTYRRVYVINARSKRARWYKHAD